ncbi:LemA protein [Pseudidiomarina indica]|uniref:LemA protein n=1 Tax=Pseudidiomarina indica TaxID=1159017 RepID=A0A1G6DC93_9GAMM|nr:LemA family protein [Pseudidiomarina indica]SDB42719.1 LemA protein [Pseudidiomarina indica]
MSTGTIILLIVIVILFYVFIIYNKLVRLKNQFQNAFAQIEVQLKRRYDLIPNLVETAKAYLSHERETLEAVIAARNQAAAALPLAASDPTNPQTMQQLSGAEAALGSALGRLNVVMEAYPDLKANQNMMQLSEELTSTENRVAFARQAYNDAVTAYNTYRQSFPQIVIAGAIGHGSQANLLEFADSAAIQAAPKVQF